MGNKHQGFVPFEINGEEHQLRLGFSQIAAADSQLGTSSVNASMAGRVDAILTLLTVGLNNPANGKGMARILRTAINRNEVNPIYAAERIAEALKASGVLGDGDDDDDEDEPGEA